MTNLMTRRAAMVGTAATTVICLLGSAHAAPEGKALAEQFAALEKRSKGRLGVTLLDTGTGVVTSYRGDERFALCSTFKLLLAAAILARVDAGEEQLDRKIPFSKADILPHSPIVEKHLAKGEASVAELCAGTLQYSDNAAANLLLATMGGPAGLTRFLASNGDPVTRLDRTEPTLNLFAPGELRDTTTPDAMVATMERLLVGDVLSAPSRKQLNEWLIDNTTGDAKLRAGLPKGWTVGDKTGMGPKGETNDVAILWPVASKPILVAVYLSECDEPLEARNAVHAEIGRMIGASYGAG
jgi:beta-lactamase class A